MNLEAGRGGFQAFDINAVPNSPLKGLEMVNDMNIDIKVVNTARSNSREEPSLSS